MKTKKWPTMKTKNLKFRHEPEIDIDATVTMDNKCVVAVHWFNGVMDDQQFFPSEAERYGWALIMAAQCCRAKIRAEKRAKQEAELKQARDKKKGQV